MNKNNDYNLKLILSTAREKKGYSQRKLAKAIGIHHSSLNDLENGRIKKIDVEVLRKIAEVLDLSLDLLLKASGYNQIAFMFEQKSSLNRKSTKDLKNLIEEYRMSQMDLLDDAYKKRRIVADCRARLNSLAIKLENYDMYKGLWTIDKIAEEIRDIYKELADSGKKYDYSKLPRDM